MPVVAIASRALSNVSVPRTNVLGSLLDLKSCVVRGHNVFVPMSQSPRSFLLWPAHSGGSRGKKVDCRLFFFSWAPSLTMTCLEAEQARSVAANVTDHILVPLD